MPAIIFLYEDHISLSVAVTLCRALYLRVRKRILAFMQKLLVRKIFLCKPTPGRVSKVVTLAPMQKLGLTDAHGRDVKARGDSSPHWAWAECSALACGQIEARTLP
jgi:hypothetical protein